MVSSPPPHDALPGDLAPGRLPRRFVVAALVWAVLALAAGLLIALELAFWPANAAPPLSFGRMRPVHTTLAVFAFAGNLLFAGIYESSGRLLGAASGPRLGALHFWTWQLAAAAAAVTLPLGHSQGLRLGEPEWPIDLLLAVSWLAFAGAFFSMMRRRASARLHPAIWFYTATVVVVGVLQIVSGLAIPVAALQSYSLFGGAQGALVGAWLQTGLLVFLVVPLFGLLYDILPSAAGRPIHSRRLTLLHFWGLLVALGWTAPAALLDTALPDWAQAAGAAFTLVLWAPAWAGVLNALFTLRGAWQRLKDEPALRFFVAAVLFFAAAALESSLLGTRGAATLAHYTDAIIGHVHLLALGWTGLGGAAVLYWIVPRLWRAPLRSRAAAGAHLYLATVGILVYVSAMWIAGATQALMLRAEGPDGGLAYSFVETLNALRLNTWARFGGGLLYTAGVVVMVWNLAMTIRAGRAGRAGQSGRVDGNERPDGAELPRPAFVPARLAPLLLGPPVLLVAAVLGLLVAAGFANALAALVLFLVAAFLAAGGVAAAASPGEPGWHARLETRGLALAVLAGAASLVGGIVELAPLVASGPEPVAGESEPYTPLQLEGRDVYLAEGCQACHSQMIRPFLWEVARYGEVSSPAESLHDHPAQWGARRVGPDLARIGGRYPNLWHHDHLVNPRAVTPGSTMPSYRHLLDETVDFTATAAKMRALRAAGVPYPDGAIDRAEASARAEAAAIAADLARTGPVQIAPDTAMVALIAYLQRVGQPP